MSLVSVVIPAHNAERTVRAAIDSVLAQTHTDLEVLIVDDGSTDATASIVEAYGPPVSCLRSANRGVSQARNLGLARAAGELVAMIDADDLWQPTKLERQLEMLAFRSDADVSTTGSLRVTEDLRVLEELPAHDYFNPCAALLLYSQVLGTCSSVLIRREILAEIGGFDSRFSQCADVDLFLRLSRRTRFAVVHAPLVLYSARRPPRRAGAGTNQGTPAAAAGDLAHRRSPHRGAQGGGVGPHRGGRQVVVALDRRK